MPTDHGDVRAALSEEQIDQLIRSLPQTLRDASEEFYQCWLTVINAYRFEQGYSAARKEALIYRDATCRAILQHQAMAWAKHRLTF